MSDAYFELPNDGEMHEFRVPLSPDGPWLDTQRAAMAAIAPVLDSLEAEINRHGPVDLMQAYCVALGAIQEVNMDKATLEKFVAVLMADRTHHHIEAAP